MSKPWADCVPLARERLDWALRHIEDFNSSIAAFLEDGPYAVVPNRKGERNGCVKIVYVFRGTRKPPGFLRFLAGDIIHNLRATVDNLVWGAANVSGADARLGLQFKDGPADFAKFASNKKLDQLPAPIRGWYEDEQLHRRPELQAWQNERPITIQRPSTLHILTKLWNKDKHRSPALMGSAAPAVWMGFATADGGWRPFTNADGIRVYHGGRGAGVVKDGTEMAEFHVPADKALDFKPRFTVDVAFKDGPSIARSFLFDAERHIRHEVLPKFEPFLT